MTADRPEDMEERLRASLRAYAELVDAPEEPAVRAPGPPRVAGHRRWRGAALVAAAAVAVVSGSVWLVGVDRSGPVVAAGNGSTASTAESSVETAEGDTRAGTSGGLAEAPAGPGAVLAAPPSPQVGDTYPVDLLTHCGVVGTDIGGAWFAAEVPLVDGPGNPPPGWDNPYQRGTLTLLAADEAVFRDDSGHEVRFRAAGESARPAPCE
jgi:hypothetical protein